MLARALQDGRPSTRSSPTLGSGLVRTCSAAALLLLLAFAGLAPAGQAVPAPPPSAPTAISFATAGFGFATSSDGASWRAETVVQPGGLADVAYGAGTWLAVGNHVAHVSRDASHWDPVTPVPLDPVLQRRFTGVEYGDMSGGPRFVAVGARYQGTVDAIVSSADLLSWDVRPVVARGLRAIAHGMPGGQGTFVAVGQDAMAVRSTDGNLWVPSLLGIDAHAIGSDGSGFLAVGASGRVAKSADGLAWTAGAVPGVTGTLRTVAWGDGRWVVAGDNGVVATSPDGIAWTVTAVAGADPAIRWLGATYGEGRFVISSHGMAPNATSGSSPLAISSDGLSWQLRPSTGTRYYGPSALAHADGQFVGVGSGTIVRSLDGLDWIAESDYAAGILQGLGFNGREWVAVGHAMAYTSPDAKDWTARWTGQCCPLLLDVAFAGGEWLAVGTQGTILASSDGGVHWTSRASPTTQALLGIAHRAGQWVIVGSAGTVLTSPDGTNWSVQTTGSSIQLTSVAWGDGTWVAVGRPSISVTGVDTILTSPDGVTWTARHTPGTPHFTDVAFDADAQGPRWVAVGATGALWASHDGQAWTGLQSGPRFFDTVTGWQGTWLALGGREGRMSTTGALGAWGDIRVPTYITSVEPNRPRPLHCLPEGQSVDFAAPATVHGGGGVWPYTWSAPGSIPPSTGTGASATFHYSSAGTHLVTLTDSKGASATCEITVSPPPPSLHVHAIDFVSNGNALHADVTIADEREVAVAATVVEVHLCDGDACVARTGETDEAGRARFTFPGTGTGPSTACVVGIAGDRPWLRELDHAAEGHCATHVR